MERFIFITDHKFPKSDAASKYMENIVCLTREAYGTVPIIIVCRSNESEYIYVENSTIHSIQSDSKVAYFWLAFKQIQKLKLNDLDIVFNLMGKTENLLWLYIYLYKYKNKTISNFVEHFNREYFGEGIKGYLFYLRDAIGYSIRNKYNSALAVSNYLMRSVKSNNVLCMPPLCRAPIEYEKKEWDNLRFIYPGADLNKDRIDSMIKTFLMIKKIKPEVELHLTGVKNKISDLLKKNSLKINKSDNVFVYDWLSEEKYVELLSKMDFTIIIREKNQVTYANFPSKIPVLMAKGIIPVVSDVGDYTKYYLRNNYNSFVIDGASPEVFAKEILRIVSLPGYQLELLHKNAWETAKNEFEIVNWKERFCQFIASVDNMK